LRVAGLPLPAQTQLQPQPQEWSRRRQVLPKGPAASTPLLRPASRQQVDIFRLGASSHFLSYFLFTAALFRS
jgi:hypothetical protein